MNRVIISCVSCGKNFKRSKGRANEAIRFSWNQYCSPKCQFTSRLKGEYKTCQTCNKKVWRIPKEIKNNLTGRFFCNASCAAKFNNHLRIRHKELLKTCIAENCNNLVKQRVCIYCSRKCGATARKRTTESLKREVLSKIRKFHKLNKRIPVKKEMYAAYRKARDVFGTWNKAIEIAGFKANPVLFADRCLASDGHWCDSFAEKIIDEWFHSKGIVHKRSVPYPHKFKKMTCDFVVAKYFIEFFGLKGEFKEYDRLMRLKKRLSKKHKLKLIEIKPSHIFPKNKLDKVLGFLI